MKKEPFWLTATMDKEDMGEAICLMMQKFDITPDQLAEVIGLKPVIVNSAMNGKGNHVYNVLMKTCDHYKLTTGMIINEL